MAKLPLLAQRFRRLFPSVHARVARISDWLELRVYLRENHSFRSLCRHPSHSAKRTVVFYCEQAGHIQTVAEMIALLQSGRSYSPILILGPGLPYIAAAEAGVPVETPVYEGVPRIALKGLSAAVMVTPVVGFRSRHRPEGAVVVHPLVSLTALDGVYEDDHFDGYDYVLCAGQHQIDDFIAWRARRASLAGKILVPCGYPKLDLTLSDPRCHADAEDRTVVYAPTHVYEVNSSACSLREHGKHIIQTLLDSGYRVIFRPHPVSLNDNDRTLVNHIEQTYQGNPSFSLDKSRNYMDSYARAALMVTDMSGTGFTFSFTFLRPVVFFRAVDQGKQEGFSRSAPLFVGAVARSTEELPPMLTLLLDNAATRAMRIAEFRAQAIYNLGTSASYFVERIGAVAEGKCLPEWIRL